MGTGPVGGPICRGPTMWLLAVLLLVGTVGAAPAQNLELTGRFIGKPGIDAAQSTRRFSNRTRVLHSPEHGTQVSHTAANGRVYLWYPGNQQVLTGSWRIEPARDPANVRDIGRICFLYGADTYNPATRQQGGAWSCGPIQFALTTMVDFAEGDPFGLSKRTQVPFVLTRERATIADLKRRMPGNR